MIPTLQSNSFRVAVRTAALWAKFGGATVDPHTGRDRIGDPFYAITVPWSALVVVDRTWSTVASYLSGYGQSEYPTSFDTRRLDAYAPTGADLAGRFANYDRAIGTWTNPATGQHMSCFLLLVPTWAEAENWGRRFRQMCAFDLAAGATVATETAGCEPASAWGQLQPEIRYGSL